VRNISAADIEKFGYCPLSWTLSWEENGKDDDYLHGGQRDHEKIAKSVSKAGTLEQKAVTSEKIVLWFAVVATIVSILGIDMLPFQNKPDISQILIAISLIWILAALFFLIMGFRAPIADKIIQYEKIILVFAVVAAIIAINAVIFLEMDVNMAITFEILSLIWLIVASFFLQRSLTFSQAARSLKKELNIDGSIQYVDIGQSKLLKSERYGISGRPDYVLNVDGADIPVEEKTGRVPKGPLFSHILQVAAYCLLLEETTGKHVPYGILKYGTDQHVIKFDDNLKNTLLGITDEMRSILDGKPAHRNHKRTSKCRSCSRREICPERLT